MSSSIDTTLSGRQSSGIIPPWLWVWLLLYFLGLPVVFDQGRTNLLILLTGRDGFSLVQYGLLERVMGTAEILLALTVLLGVAMILLPHIRMLYSEKKYSIIDGSSPELVQEERQTLDEVRAFLHCYSPRIVLKYGYNLPDRAMVYPLGYHRVALAVSFQFPAMWRDHRCRPQAEATLLHEIGHYRHGDAFIVGAGSFLEMLVDKWLHITAIFILVPFILAIILKDIATSINLAGSGASPQEITQHILQQIITIDLPGLGLLFFQYLFWSAFTLIILLTSIWCSEFNADRFVLDTIGSSEALVQTLNVHSTPTTWQKWFLFSLSHPPGKMRIWMISHFRETQGALALLLFFPLAYIVRFLFQLARIASYDVSLYYDNVSRDVTGQFLGYVKGFFGQMTPIWIAMALLFLCWPLMTRYWEWLFARTLTGTNRIPYRYYLLSASILLILCMLGTVIPVPSQSKTTDDSSGKSSSSAISQHLKLGEQANVGNVWSVVVRDAHISPGTSIWKPQAGNAFLLINVSLKNVSSQQQELSSGAQFSLKDSSGTSYSGTYVAPSSPPEVAYNGRINAGTTADGVLTYEVPATLHSFTLSFRAERYSNANASSQDWAIKLGSEMQSVPTTSASTAVVTTTAYIPVLQSSYQGKIENTTDNANISAPVTLSSIQEDQQRNIRGYMTISPPLVGSGPFTGTVASNRSIQFTVIPDDGSGYAAMKFTGTIQSDGSLRGEYTLPGTTQGGTWQVAP
jgi:beta-lactamase regulating signal transducer with metallopeptidase domain